MATTPPANDQGTTDGATAVVVVKGPDDGRVRDVTYLNVHNTDTADVVVTIRHAKNSINGKTTYSKIRSETVAPGNNLELISRITLSNPRDTIEVLLAGAVADNEPNIVSGWEDRDA